MPNHFLNMRQEVSLYKTAITLVYFIHLYLLILFFKKICIN